MTFREMSKRLGQARVRSSIKSIMIITKAHDDIVIKLTRDLAIHLMTSTRATGRAWRDDVVKPVNVTKLSLSDRVDDRRQPTQTLETIRCGRGVNTIIPIVSNLFIPRRRFSGTALPPPYLPIISTYKMPRNPSRWLTASINSPTLLSILRLVTFAK